MVAAGGLRPALEMPPGLVEMLLTAPTRLMLQALMVAVMVPQGQGDPLPLSGRGVRAWEPPWAALPSELFKY